MFVTSRVNNAKKAWEPCLALILEAIGFFFNLYLICIPPIYSRRSFLAIKNPKFFIFVMFVFKFFFFLLAKGNVGKRVLTEVTTNG